MTGQACNLIRDWPIRKIGHYVPILDTNDIIGTFPACESLLFGHLLHTQFLVNSTGGKDGNVAESPAILLAALLAMEVEQIGANVSAPASACISLGSNQLKACPGIQVSQIEPLGSMTISTLNEMFAKAGAQAVEGRGSSNG
ncbi:hypothetical protein BU15DRAFT_74204 [Melanogaster broomeanus]|nr:hypothetical protein BU15DRAFT_74204 [Melanogaster broomeanus]